MVQVVLVNGNVIQAFSVTWTEDNVEVILELALTNNSPKPEIEIPIHSVLYIDHR